MWWAYSLEKSTVKPIVKRIADIHGAKMQLTKNADGSGLRVTINF